MTIASPGSDQRSAAAAPEGSGQRPRRFRALRQYILPGALLAALTVLIVFPVGILVYASFVDAPPRPGAVAGSATLDHFIRLGRPGNLLALRNSLVVGIAATAFAMLVGSTLAWLVARTDVPFKPVLQVAGFSPLFMSALVGALSWSILASPRVGYLNLLFRDLGLPLEINIYSVGGIAFVLGLYYAPYAFLLVQSSMTLMNPELEQAASVHGAAPLRVISTVTFPLALPGILSAAALTFVLIVENFPVPAILGAGGGVPLLPSQMHRLMVAAPSRPNEAAAIGMVLLVIMAALVITQRLMLRRRNYVTVTGKGFRPIKVPLGKLRWPAFAFGCIYLIVAMFLPLYALLFTAASGMSFVPSFLALFNFTEWSFQGLFDLFEFPAFRLALRNSVLVGIGTALFGGLLHVTIAYVIVRTTLPGRALIEQIVMAPAAVPALVIGLGFLWAWLVLPVPLYGTLLILMLAYIARFAPQGYRSVASTMGQIHPELEESAQVSGANRARSAAWVTLPLIRPGVASMMILLFVLALRELSASIFLFTSRTRVLSILVYEQWQGASLARVAWIALVFTALLFAVSLLGRRWMSTST